MTLSPVERVTLLRRVELLAGAPGHVLAAVAGQASEVSLRTGEVLLRQGEPGDALYVVVEGLLTVLVDGRPVGHSGAGEVVGELAVLVDEPRSATVAAAQPALLLRVDRPVVEELLLDHPEVARSMITALVHRFRDRDPPP